MASGENNPDALPINIPSRQRQNRTGNNLINVAFSLAGAVAFGEKLRIYISIFFCLELLTLAVALIVLVGDSLYATFPDIIAWMVMTSLTLNIRYFSYFSLLGIFSAMF
ncbi:6750_t:CDS:2, partial [Funneliformis geosporum]